MSPPLPRQLRSGRGLGMIPRPYSKPSPRPATVVFIAFSCAGASSLPPSSARQKRAMSGVVLTRLPGPQTPDGFEHGDVAQLAVEQRVALDVAARDRGLVASGRTCAAGAAARRCAAGARRAANGPSRARSPCRPACSSCWSTPTTCRVRSRASCRPRGHEFARRPRACVMLPLSHSASTESWSSGTPLVSWRSWRTVT